MRARLPPVLVGNMKKLKDVAFGTTEQRLTRQSALLFDLIRQGGHPDADELYSRAKAEQPNLSMSTVYRNLQLFVKLGIVEERHFDNRHSCYEVRRGIEHHHLMCLGCGRIIEFECPLIQELRGSLETEHRFHITGAKVLMVGYCAACFSNGEREGKFR